MIKENLQAVRNNIELAKDRRKEAYREEEVLLIAVTKNNTVEAMREAIDNGISHIGENRIQEAKEKLAVLERDTTNHLIGHLQTNKVKQAVELFDLIHSVDSLHLASSLNKAASAIGKIQPVLVQVNLAKEESKFGIYEEDLTDALIAIDQEMSSLKLMGLMLIAPNYENKEDCRPLFAKMRQIFDKVKEMPWNRANIKYLSMGMTHDYEIAIEEGANILRVGTGIFGQRKY